MRHTLIDDRNEGERDKPELEGDVRDILALGPLEVLELALDAVRALTRAERLGRLPLDERSMGDVCATKADQTVAAHAHRNWPLSLVRVGAVLFV